MGAILKGLPNTYEAVSMTGFDPQHRRFDLTKSDEACMVYGYIRVRLDTDPTFRDQGVAPIKRLKDTHIDVTTTCWDPQQVFRVDDLGRDMVVGYGSVLVPTRPGRHERVAHMYAPQPSSALQRFRAWVSGAYPEVRCIRKPRKK